MTDRSPFLSLSGCFFVAAVLAHGPLALAEDAATPKSEPAQVIAAFVIPKDELDAKWMAALRSALVERPAALPGARLVVGEALDAALGAKAETAIGDCGSDLSCIAQLGKKAKAQRVWMARARPADTGMNVQCLVVNVATAEIENTAAFAVPSPAETKTVVAAKLAELFPEAAIANATPANAGTNGAAPGSEMDLVFDIDAAASPKPPPASPPAETATAEKPATTADANPAADSSPPVKIASDFSTAEPHAARPAAPNGAAEAVTSGPALPDLVDVNGARVPFWRWPLPRYISGPVAGVGLATVTLGLIFGARASSANGSIKSGMTQVRAHQKLNDANSNAHRANICFVLGGLTTAAGGTLLALDLLHWEF